MSSNPPNYLCAFRIPRSSYELIKKVAPFKKTLSGEEDSRYGLLGDKIPVNVEDDDIEQSADVVESLTDNSGEKRLSVPLVSKAKRTGTKIEDHEWIKSISAKGYVVVDLPQYMDVYKRIITAFESISKHLLTESAQYGGLTTKEYFTMIAKIWRHYVVKFNPAQFMCIFSTSIKHMQVGGLVHMDLNIPYTGNNLTPIVIALYYITYFKPFVTVKKIQEHIINPVKNEIDHTRDQELQQTVEEACRNVQKRMAAINKISMNSLMSNTY